VHTIEIDPQSPLRLSSLHLMPETRVVLSEAAKSRIRACRAYLDTFDGGEAVYGINTGFGALYNTTIPDEDLHTLQRNLLLSHACGMGEEVPHEVVRCMLLLKIKGLAFGHSGVQLATVERLCAMFNHQVLPVVYTQGSLGASGDLAPLAHLSLPLIGKGEVWLDGQKLPAAEALEKMKWKPIDLQSKEGLALINGTQFMSAYAGWCVMQAEAIWQKGIGIAAMSLDAFDGRSEPFDPLTHQVRPHSGQLTAADAMAHWLEGSSIQKKTKQHVQDPYSFRCIPQVHGASYDALQYARHVVEVEINAVTDNPIVFPEHNKIISGGNFHGQPLALALDFLAIAVAELGSIAERRIYKLISGQRGLPPFLAPNAGLNSGFMIPQYTAASIVSQNKQLCSPASVDTIDSSQGQEDHVSMGANAATKCFRVVHNVRRILAIEALTASQALECRRPWQSSEKVEALFQIVRKAAPFMPADAYLHPMMEAVEKTLFE
jgi:histidine ammonia-lyase